MVKTVDIDIDGAPPDVVLACDWNNAEASLAIEMTAPMINCRSLANDASSPLPFAICHSFGIDLERAVSNVAPHEEVKKFLAKIHD